MIAMEMNVEPVDQEVTVELPRFGTCTYRESEVLSLPWGLPGFAGHRRFLALSLEGQERFIWLQSLDDVAVAIPAADPWQIFPDYNPQLPAYALPSLGIEHPEDFVTLCVVVVTAGAAEMTMNLLAPVLINLKTRVARQITLERGEYSVRTPLPRVPVTEEVPAG